MDDTTSIQQRNQMIDPSIPKSPFPIETLTSPKPVQAATTSSNPLLAQQKYPSTKFNTPNPGIINKFITRFGNGGLQLSNRFIVLCHGPNVNFNFFDKPAQKIQQERQTISQVYKNEFINFKTALSMPMKERLALACQNVMLPSKGIMSQELNVVGNGPPVVHAYAENYVNELKINFLCSADFFERQYFVNWMESVINRGTHEVAMYETYAQPWTIIIACLPQDMGNAGYSGRFASTEKQGQGVDFDKIINSIGNSNTASEIYFVKCEHVYPSKISEIEFNQASNNQFARFEVTFKYHRWIDPVVDYNYNRNVDIQEIIPEEKLSPFERFMKTAREIAKYAKYADPRELKGLIINEGLGQLNDVLGEGTVETIASGGQAVDVFIKSDSIAKSSILNPKEYLNTLVGR